MGHAETRWRSLSDAELVTACRSDVAAFGELVRCHQDFVYGAALRVVRNPTAAEDLAQEAFADAEFIEATIAVER